MIRLAARPGSCVVTAFLKSAARAAGASVFSGFESRVMKSSVPGPIISAPPADATTATARSFGSRAAALSAAQPPILKPKRATRRGSTNESFLAAASAAPACAGRVVKRYFPLEPQAPRKDGATEAIPFAIRARWISTLFSAPGKP